MHYCPADHATVYQMFSGGKEWFCQECYSAGAEIYEGPYPAAPIEAGPRARLLSVPGGFEQLKEQMQNEFERLNDVQD